MVFVVRFAPVQWEFVNCSMEWCRFTGVVRQRVSVPEVFPPGFGDRICVVCRVFHYCRLNIVCLKREIGKGSIPFVLLPFECEAPFAGPGWWVIGEVRFVSFVEVPSQRVAGWGADYLRFFQVDSVVFWCLFGLRTVVTNGVRDAFRLLLFLQSADYWSWNWRSGRCVFRDWGNFVLPRGGPDDRFGLGELDVTIYSFVSYY